MTARGCLRAGLRLSLPDGGGASGGGAGLQIRLKHTPRCSLSLGGPALAQHLHQGLIEDSIPSRMPGALSHAGRLGPGLPLRPQPGEQLGQVAVLWAELPLQSLPEPPRKRGAAVTRGDRDAQSAPAHQGREDEGGSIRIICHVHPDSPAARSGGDAAVESVIVGGCHYQRCPFEVVFMELPLKKGHPFRHCPDFRGHHSDRGSGFDQRPCLSRGHRPASNDETATSLHVETGLQVHGLCAIPRFQSGGLVACSRSHAQKDNAR